MVAAVPGIVQQSNGYGASPVSGKDWRVVTRSSLHAWREPIAVGRAQDANGPSGYGQTFFGFLPIENVFGSSDTNSYTAGLNFAHWP
jgi:hypothetical protein